MSTSPSTTWQATPSYAYFDYASSFPPANVALDVMARAARESWGHPGSLHDYGSRAARALDDARRSVAEYLGTPWQEVVFTTSTRDGLAMALDHVLASLPPGTTIAASRQDHPALLKLLIRAGEMGHATVFLSLPEGKATEDDRKTVASASLVLLSMVNHELGTSNRSLLEAVGPKTVRIVDAAQGCAFLPMDWLNDGRTYYAMGGAKLGAPGGVGVLRVPVAEFYAARTLGTPFEGDTVAWLPAIGLGAVCAERRLARSELFRVARERERELWEVMRAASPDVVVNGADGLRTGTILNVSFSGVSGKALSSALGLERICISHTSACQASRADASPVVRAAYLGSPERAVGATRWSLSESVTKDDIERVASVLPRVLAMSRDPGRRP